MTQYPKSNNFLPNSNGSFHGEYYENDMQNNNEDEPNYDNLVENLINPEAHQSLSPELNQEKLIPNRHGAGVSYRTSRIAPPLASNNAAYNHEPPLVSVRLVPQNLTSNEAYLSPNDASSFQVRSPSSESQFLRSPILQNGSERFLDDYNDSNASRLITPASLPKIMSAIQMENSHHTVPKGEFLNPEVKKNYVPSFSQNNSGANLNTSPTKNVTISGTRFSKFFKRKSSYSNDTSNTSFANISGLDKDMNSLLIGRNDAANATSLLRSSSSHQCSFRDESYDDESQNNTSFVYNTVSSSSSLLNKLHAKRHNYDKSDDKDAAVLEFNNFLSEKYYDLFNFNWDELAQIYLFGNLFSTIFNISGTANPKELKNKIFGWLLAGGDQTGSVNFEFSNNNFNSSQIENTDEAILQLLVSLVICLDPFKNAVSHLKQITEGDLHNKNRSNPNPQGIKSQNQDHSNLEKVATKNSGIPIPLSQALLANWMVEFENEGGFNDSKSLLMFRRAARNSYALQYLINSGFFESALKLLEKLLKLTPSILLAERFGNFLVNQNNFGDYNLQEAFFHLNAMLMKDNRTSLGMSLFGIANILHSERSYNKAINLFEIGAHLSFDLDCCGMAAMGLNNGYGFGKKHGKEFKFQRKRRAAQIYRIIKANGGELDVGTSWAFKDKYD